MKTLWVTVKLTDKQALSLAHAAENASPVPARESYVLSSVARRLRRAVGASRSGLRSGMPVA
jgi:hypothetical protein